MSRDKISSSTASLGGGFLWRRKRLTTLESRFHFPVENFSTSSDGDKPSKALQKPIELNRNGTSSEGKTVFYLESPVGQKMTEDFNFCLKSHRFSPRKAGRLWRWCCEDC